MTTTPFRLGTRGSQLALFQARTVARLVEAAGGPACEIVIIKTSGDRLQEAPLSEVGGKRLFVKELEDALLEDAIDLAVHSSKDMPAVLPPGLMIAGVLPREDPRDAVVLPAAQPPLAAGAGIEALVARLGSSPTIGTSSVRRIAEMSRLFPAAHFVAIRGNLDTRLRKLDDGGYDCLVLAAAGLRRLEFGHRISMALDPVAVVPAPGQGVIAIEVRERDARARAIAERISDAGAWTALTAERAVVERLGGGCQTPIGALATVIGDNRLHLSATVLTLDGARSVRSVIEGEADDAVALGERVADELLAGGAGEILDEVKRRQGVHPNE